MFNKNLIKQLINPYNSGNVDRIIYFRGNSNSLLFSSQRALCKEVFEEPRMFLFVSVETTATFSHFCKF